MVSKVIQKEVSVDENRLFEMLGMDANFYETFEKLMAKKDSFSLIVGPDLYKHPNASNLAHLVGLFENASAFKVVMIPTLTNTLGVALINELSSEVGSYTIGYNTKGDFTLSALGDGDLDMPAINQQEGTLTSINKRVNPTNAALPYGGYTLNDIANALGLQAEYTIDYTIKLGENQSFKAMAFDDLPDYYTNAGEEIRGYELNNLDVQKDVTIQVEKIDDSLTLGDKLIYLANPVRQFTDFTYKTTYLDEKSGVYMSEEFLLKSDFKEGESVKVTTSCGSVVAQIVSDNKIGGEIVLLPTFDSKLNAEALTKGYRFSTASIEKV